ncbi:S9 family peptidase [Oxalobacteraceae bacterium]|nr:S9 family peptidase [Oxalobacteraceae bacterium]
MFLCASASNAGLAEAPVAVPALPPLSAFFDNPVFSGALLSPSGTYLAAKVTPAAAAGTRERLAVIDLSNNTIKVVAQFPDADIDNVQWVNDRRLAFNVSDNAIAPGDVRYAPGLYAINADGSEFRRLAYRGADGNISNTSRALLPWHTYMLDQPGSQDSDAIYVRNVQFHNDDIEYTSLVKLDTVSGRGTPVPRPGATDEWLLDQHGVPRIATVIVKDQETIHYLDPASGQWRVIASFNAYHGGKEAFTPLAFGPDGKLYVTARAGKDKRGLYTFDLLSNKLSAAPLLMVEGYDFSGKLIMDRHQLLGVRYEGENEDTVWFDPAMQALQAEIDALLPSTVNLISPPLAAQTPWVLVEAYSDVQPRAFLLYQREKKKFNPVGTSYDRIEPGQMARVKLLHYKARDGRDIPVWLTLPKGQDRKLPMVVLVHGGPFVRGRSWRWDPEAQFLASRGYAVLEPEFRGSAGFGWDHQRAGLKQLGLSMQDDLADGTRWAVAQGYADPARVCIAGASYGGYATLMGLIKDPELYRCGIDWLGVTDIPLLYTGSWRYTSDLSDDTKRYSMPATFGDPVKDAAQLKATSPLLLADKLKQPLLMAYGGADERVPLHHGIKFRDAIRPYNKQVEWVEYPEEGHGWSLPATRIDFWSRVEKFLARYNGPQ